MGFRKTAAYFRHQVAWQHHVDGVERIGPQLDGRMERFMKSKTVEKCLCLYGKIPDDIVYINHNGRDLYLKSLNCFAEVKFEKHSMFTEKGNRKNLIGKGMKMFNSNGTNKYKSLPEHYARYILILDSRGAALARRPGPEMLDFKGDSIELKGFEWDDVEVLFGFQDIEPSVRYSALTKEEQNFWTDKLDELVADFTKIVIASSKRTSPNKTKKGRKCLIG